MEKRDGDREELNGDETRWAFTANAVSQRHLAVINSNNYPTVTVDSALLNLQ